MPFFPKTPHLSVHVPVPLVEAPVLVKVLSLVFFEPVQKVALIPFAVRKAVGPVPVESVVLEIAHVDVAVGVMVEPLPHHLLVDDLANVNVPVADCALLDTLFEQLFLVVDVLCLKQIYQKLVLVLQRHLLVAEGGAVEVQLLRLQLMLLRKLFIGRLDQLLQLQVTGELKLLLIFQLTLLKRL